MPMDAFTNPHASQMKGIFGDFTGFLGIEILFVYFRIVMILLD